MLTVYEKMGVKLFCMDKGGEQKFFNMSKQGGSIK